MRQKHLPTTIVQTLAVSWDKVGRGGENAVQRSQLPLALEVPSDELSRLRGQLFIHRVSWSQTDCFAAYREQCEKTKSEHREVRIGPITVVEVDNGCTVKWEWDRWSVGAPRRWERDENGNEVAKTKSLTVPDGKWSRVRWNGRFSCVDTGNWSYDLVTVNVAFFKEVVPDNRVFLDSDPHVEFESLADLW